MSSKPKERRVVTNQAFRGELKPTEPTTEPVVEPTPEPTPGPAAD